MVAQVWLISSNNLDQQHLVICTKVWFRTNNRSDLHEILKTVFTIFKNQQRDIITSIFFFNISCKQVSRMNLINKRTSITPISHFYWIWILYPLLKWNARAGRGLKSYLQALIGIRYKLASTGIRSALRARMWIPVPLLKLGKLITSISQFPHL